MREILSAHDDILKAITAGRQRKALALMESHLKVNLVLFTHEARARARRVQRNGAPSRSSEH
jgi:hypothetical protein